MKLYEISLQQPHFDALQHDSIFAKWFNISPAGEWRKKNAALPPSIAPILFTKMNRRIVVVSR